MLILFVLAALQAAPSAEAAGQRPPASSADLPQWSRGPSADEMAKAYPPAALEQNLAGSGTVECTVIASGALTDCAVVDESPQQLGFGAAALAVAPRFMLPTKSPSGASTVGRTVRVPVRWINKAASQEPLIIVYDDANRSGFMAMNCRVAADRGVDNCVVVDAQPPSTRLFDLAAQRIQSYHVTGRARPGARVLLPIEVRRSGT